MRICIECTLHPFQASSQLFTVTGTTDDTDACIASAFSLNYCVMSLLRGLVLEVDSLGKNMTVTMVDC